MPAECPGPKEGEVYYHAARYHTNQEGYGGSIKNFASSYLEVHNGTWFYVGMTDEEINASPFVTPNTDGWFAQMRFPIMGNDPLDGSGTHVTLHMTISHCPGDFTGSIVPVGKEKIHDACKKTSNMVVATVYKGNEYRNKMAKYHCVLRPGQRYFFNMATPGNPAPEDAESIESRNADFVAKVKDLWGNDPRIRGGRLVGARMAESRIHQGPKYLPDAKACVGKNEPKPLHYYESFASHVLPYRNRTCGRQQGGPGRSMTCYDPYNLLPPQEFRAQTVAGTYPGQSDHVWVEGYGAPLYSVYMCEDTQALSTVSDGELMRSLSPVCAAHREGEMSSYNSFDEKSGFDKEGNRLKTYFSRNMHYSFVKQCQFDKERQRFDWVAVTAANKSLGIKEQTLSRTFKGALLEVDNDKCLVNGHKYSVGDEASLNCRALYGQRGKLRRPAETRTLECQQRTEKGAPVMVVKATGFDLSRAMTLDGKNAVGACKIKPE